MKKQLLLLGAFVATTFLVNAQSARQFKVVKVDRTHSSARSTFSMDRVNPNAAAGNPLPVGTVHTAKRSAGLDVQRTKISGSVNFFTLLVTNQNCVDVDPNLNAVAFTHRQTNDPNNNLSGNNVQVAFSSDKGATFKNIPVYVGTDQNRGRYPQGAIGNKAGNTSANEAILAVTGPITSGAGWTGNYFASTKVGSSDVKTQEVKTNGDPGVVNQGMARVSMQFAGGKFYALGYDYDANATTNATQRFNGVVVNTGTPNFTTGAVAWEAKNVPVNFAIDADSNRIYQEFGQMTWAQDGSAGYIVSIGADPAKAAAGDTTYYPIIQKSTNGGTSWTTLPYYDMKQIQVLIDSCTDATYTDLIFGFNQTLDLAVDKNNALHIFVTCNPYNPVTGELLNTNHMFDLVRTAEGSWSANFIDRLVATTADAGELTKFTDLTQDARMQMALSKDGSKVFYMYEDTRNGDPTNVAPDIFGRGYDVDTKKFTSVINFTELSDFTSNNYFMFVGNRTIDAPGEWNIALTTSDQASSANTDGGSPADHYFLTGVKFTNADFLGINNVKNAGFEVSANYPNPFSDKTAIAVKSVKPMEVTLKVTNMTGQVMDTQSAFVSGTYKFNVNRDNLSAGVYFYTISANGNSVTNKMIVK